MYLIFWRRISYMCRRGLFIIHEVGSRHRCWFQSAVVFIWQIAPKWKTAICRQQKCRQILQMISWGQNAQWSKALKLLRTDWWWVSLCFLGADSKRWEKMVCLLLGSCCCRRRIPGFGTLRTLPIWNRVLIVFWCDWGLDFHWWNWAAFWLYI